MQWMYTLHIKLLAFFYPAKLFEKINQLEWYQQTLQSWVEEQHISPHSSMLEVGCATGALSRHLSMHYTLTAVDASKSMIKRAQKHTSHVDFLVADVYALPFPSGYFDTVVASSLLNVLEHKKKALLEMKRVCKHDGKVTFLVPLKGFDDTHAKQLSQTLQLTGFAKAALYAWHTMAKKMSIEEIEDLVQTCGLSIKETKEYLEGMVISVSIH